jgi:DNA-binding LacI/PurR family transcriptional regulator
LRSPDLQLCTFHNRLSSQSILRASQVSPELAADLTANEVAAVLNPAPPQRYRGNIAIDHAKGAGEAIAHLHGLGHRCFVFIEGPRHRPSTLMARQAMTDALAPWGHPREFLEGENTLESGAAAVRCLIEAKRLPGALLCDNDVCARWGRSAH